MYTPILVSYRVLEYFLWVEYHNPRRGWALPLFLESHLCRIYTSFEENASTQFLKAIMNELKCGVDRLRQNFTTIKRWVGKEATKLLTYYFHIWFAGNPRCCGTLQSFYWNLQNNCLKSLPSSARTLRQVRDRNWLYGYSRVILILLHIKPGNSNTMRDIASCLCFKVGAAVELRDTCHYRSDRLMTAPTVLYSLLTSNHAFVLRSHIADLPIQRTHHSE